jgi:hypothetical protein
MLTCSKCGHHDQIEHVTTRWGNEIHCHFCGNVAVEGVKARWAIEEKAYTARKPTESEIAIGKKCIESLTEQYRKSEYYVKPAIIESLLHDNQEDSMAKCSVEGCEKKVWVKGYCAKHYTEAFGKAYKPPSEAAKRASRVKAKPEAIQERVEQGKIPPPFSETKAPEPEPKAPTLADKLEQIEAEKAIPLFQIFLDPELLDELTKKAKAEYRTPEQQAAYLIDRALKKDSYSL